MLAVLPFYVELLLGENSGTDGMMALRVLRLFRITRVLKLIRYDPLLYFYFHFISLRIIINISCQRSSVYPVSDYFLFVYYLCAKNIILLFRGSRDG